MIKVTRATPKAYRYACMNFHYAKAVPAVKYAYNIYEDDAWCGCIIFSSGATPNIGHFAGLVQGEILELVRVALNGKQKTTSECLAAALRQLHNDAPEVKMLVSFADADQNHFGTIYQATNWFYLGLTMEGELSAFIVRGQKMHPKTAHSKGWVQSIDWIKENIDPNAEEFITKGKRKYIMCFDKRFRKEWIKKALPYPKDKTTNQ